MIIPFKYNQETKTFSFKSEDSIELSKYLPMNNLKLFSKLEYVIGSRPDFMDDFGPGIYPIFDPLLDNELQYASEYLTWIKSDFKVIDPMIEYDIKRMSIGLLCLVSFDYQGSLDLFYNIKSHKYIIVNHIDNVTKNIRSTNDIIKSIKDYINSEYRDAEKYQWYGWEDYEIKEAKNYYNKFIKGIETYLPKLKL